jgi:uncharacterized protein YutE (UPF0331/DUF86 family)
MGSIDREKVTQYEAEIREARNVLAEITAGDIEDFIRDPMKIRAIKYTLIVPVEAICNLCWHILTKKAHIVVEEYMEALLKMQEKGFLSEEIASLLIPLIKLRHQLIHDYWKTDDRRLFLETKSNLKTIDKFVSEINQTLFDT